MERTMPSRKPILIRGLIYPMGKIGILDFCEVLIVVDKYIEFCGNADSQEFSEIYTSLKEKYGGTIEEIVLPKGHIVLPGFIDSHVHPLSAQLQNLGCDLSDAKDLGEALERLRNFVLMNPNDPWIFAHGYREEWFPAILGNENTDEKCETVEKSMPNLISKVITKPIKKLRKNIAVGISKRDTKRKFKGAKCKGGKKFASISTPNASILDKYVSSFKPVVIMRYDGHTYWCNTHVLNISRAREKIFKYREETIEKLPNGELAGIFKDESMKILKEVFPEVSLERKLSCGREALKKLLRAGVTCFNDAMTRKSHYEIYTSLYNNENEKIFIYPRCHMTFAYEEFLIKKNETNKEEFENFESGKLDFINKFKIPKGDMIRSDAIKIFVDGVVESKTAYMLEPYKNCFPENRGVCYYDDLTLNRIIKECSEHGYQLHFHSVGDAATRKVIDCLSNFDFRKNRVPILAHLQVVESIDIEKFAKHNFGANFSPFWCHNDIGDDSHLLGQQRTTRQYPIKSFLKTRAIVGFGSDWPVSSYKPLEGIQVSVTHKPLITQTNEKEKFSEGEEISVAEAVYAYTMGSATLLGRNEELGSLEKGKFADFIILDKNIFECSHDEIYKTSIYKICVGGSFTKDILFKV